MHVIVSAHTTTIQQMTKSFPYLILLCLGTVASEVEYIIRPSQSPSCGDHCSSNSESVDNCLILSQFVNNSNNYRTNGTRLIFSPGNYSLESKLIIENIHSFSMFAKAVINCGHNARFEFKVVTMSGLEFVECFENQVVSIDQFQLKDCSFFGNGQAIVSQT